MEILLVGDPPSLCHMNYWGKMNIQVSACGFYFFFCSFLNNHRKRVELKEASLSLSLDLFEIGEFIPSSVSMLYFVIKWAQICVILDFGGQFKVESAYK